MRRHKASSVESSQRQATGPRWTAFLVSLLATAILVLGMSASAWAAPSISSVGVSSVTSTTALLSAKVDPEGEATTYHFAYGTSDCGSNPCTSVPVPDGSAGSGSTVVNVSHELSGLQAGSTYHFRIVATNGSGSSEGVDHVFKTYSPPLVSECPNQAFRTGPAANLPDCRAYEMVSPAEKNGGDITTICNIGCFRTALNQVSVDGEKITYSSYKAFGDAKGSLYSNQFVASRGPNGWSTHGLSPAHNGHIFPEYAPTWDLDIQFKAFTPDLSSAWLTDDAEPAITPDAVEGEVNLYRRDNATDTFHSLIDTLPAESDWTGGGGGHGYSMEVGGYSADGNHLVLKATATLTPDAHGTQPQIYDYSGGEFHLVSVLPNGTQDPNGAGVGAGDGNEGRFGNILRAVSDDGSRIFWTSGEGLYVRENPDAPQSAVNGSDECTEPGKACTVLLVEGSPAAEVAFRTASTDGSRLLFGLGQSLYAMDVDTQVPNLVAGEVIGGVAGASNDLSRFYFVSKENLATGATAGERNLYLDDHGGIRFIAQLVGADVGESPGIVSTVTAPAPYSRNSRVSADGTHLAFMSESKGLAEEVAGYDNTDAKSGKADSEIYVYDSTANAGTGQLVCASCNPSGAQPVGRPRQRPDQVHDEPTPLWGAAWLSTAESNLYTLTPLSADGKRLFFNSYDALLPEDTNGMQDVYEWQQQGTGGCEKAEGCIGLLSSGESPQSSEFVDASPDGRNVFFSTGSSLVAHDPGLVDIYDARIDGGFASANPSAACEGETCQSPVAAPNDPTPASSAYSGPGNARETTRGKKKHKKHKKKQHKAGRHARHAAQKKG